MSRAHRFWLWLIAVLILPSLVSAQGSIVSGIVRSQTQSPVRGAFVQIPALQLSAITSDNGSYRLTVPTGAATGIVTMTVMSIGYKSAEVQVTLRPVVRQDVELVEQAISLDEVVVTGTAGRQERRAQAAVVTSISAAKVAEVAPVQSLTNLLQARTPGVVIRNNSGTSGTSSTIRIRGQASINLSNEPLIFINGIRSQGGSRQMFGVGNQAGGYLNDIKVEDIESIEVVKGPAAATLYGSDANAGVINIITKRGRTQSGWTQSLSLEYGEATPAFTPPDNFSRCVAGNATNAVLAACANVPVGTVLQDNPLKRESSFGDGRSRNLAWNLRGGGERFAAYLSLGADEEQGTLNNNIYGHLSGSLAFDFFVSEKFKVQSDFRMGRVKTQLPRNDNDIYGYLGGGLLGDPRTRGAAKDGWYGNYRQTLALRAYENVDKTMRIQPRVSAEFTPFTWFTNRLTLGADLSRVNAYSFWAKNDIGWWDDAPRNTGQINEARRAIDRITLDYIGNVTRNLTSDLRGDFSFGTQVLTRKQDDVGSSGNGLINNEVRTVNSASSNITGSQSVSEDRTIGFFGQSQFSWMDKVYVQVGARVDQASSFGIDSEPFFSPKVGVSYVLSDENYFRSLVPENLVNALRLRAAYGVTGRSPSSGARSTYSPTVNQISPTATGIGVSPGATGNADLKAEKGQELEAGFEAGFLNDRLGLEVTYFHKKGVDQILSLPLPGSVGSNAPDVNIGSLLNKGWEVSSNLRALTMSNVSLELRATLNTLHNELLDLGGAPTSATRKPGFPLNGLWDYPIRSIDLVNNVVTVSDTLEFIGNSVNLPDWESTFSSTLTLFKNFTFYAQMDARGGLVTFDNTEQFRDRSNGFTKINVYGCAAFMPDPTQACDDAAKIKYMRKYGCIQPCTRAWVTETWVDSLGANRGNRTLVRGDVRGDYIQDAGFIRLREVSASYHIPRDLVQRYMRAQTAQLTFGMRNNLKTWTDFAGLDPETDQFLTVPADRRWSVRLNFTF